MQRLSLRVTSDPAHLASVRRAVEAFCATAGFGDRAVGEVGLCVNEAMANITRHAYGGAVDKPIQLEAKFDDQRLTITLRDWGNGKDPSAVPAKTDPLTPGGLGLICMKSMMDEVVFTPQPDGMLLMLGKKLASARVGECCG